MRTVHLLMRRPPDDELPHVQGRVLSLLWRRRGTDTYQKDVEKEYDVTRSTASSLLTRMERDGLITRSGVSFDARLKKLTLTERGKAICEKTEQKIDAAEIAIRRGISEEDLNIFFQVLRQIRQNLGADEEEE